MWSQAVTSAKAEAHWSGRSTVPALWLLRAPPICRRGNAGRNILRGDGLNVDFSLYKEFLLDEKRKFQLRFEGFNAFNLHSFTFPTTTVNDPNFARIFGSSPARVMQVAAKFVY